MKIWMLLILCLLATAHNYANNVQLTNISVSNNVTNTGKVIQFDLSWENGWRTTSTGNLDGVWVFFKFKDTDGTWRHLNFTGTNNNMPPGASFDMGNNGGITGVGMFVYRSQNGFGNTVFNGIRAGIQSYPGTLDVRGFAIEMVYIPQGSFYAGDGNTSSNYYSDSTAATPYQVTGLGSTIQMGNIAGRLYDGLMQIPYTGNLSNFPTGYEAFWIMKYEVSQGAYRDFLNTLTKQQQESRFHVDINSVANSPIMSFNQTLHDNFLVVDTAAGTIRPAVVRCGNNDSVTYEWKPVLILNWPDVAAYLDWAGLRPYTELEYEKACRGSLGAQLGEYAWGNNTLNNWARPNSTGNGTVIQLAMTDRGEINERATNMSVALGNATYGSIPYAGGSTPGYLNLIRGGGFATAFSTRTSSGASYYGVMELSGNAEEPVVTTRNAAGRSFTGKHGDGILTPQGNANENNWPGVNGYTGRDNPAGVYNGGNGVTGDGGFTIRGGSHLGGTVQMRVSYRDGYGGTGTATPAIRYEMGIRGVRNVN
jgi:Sulfatase-modifying factor enzyme 1